MNPLTPAQSPLRAHYAPSGGGAVFRSKRSRQNVTGERYSASGSHTPEQVNQPREAVEGFLPMREHDRQFLPSRRPLMPSMENTCTIDTAPIRDPGQERTDLLHPLPRTRGAKIPCSDECRR